MKIRGRKYGRLKKDGVISRGRGKENKEGEKKERKTCRENVIGTVED